MEPKLTARRRVTVRPTVLYAFVAGAVIAGGLALLATSGGDDDSQKPETAAASGKPAFISNREQGRYAKNSVERAFLDYWASLQYGAWDDAVTFFDPGLRDFIGSERLSESFKNQDTFYAHTSPHIVSVQRKGRNRAIRYRFVDPSGAESRRAITFRREGKKWRIVFDSYLDDVLRAYAQSVAQQRINPTAKAPGARALRAGAAALRLQSRYRTQLEKKARRQRAAQSAQNAEQSPAP
jgi:hypothetical protein